MIITVAGNLGKEAESRYTPAGQEVVSFSVAEKSGKDVTTWVRCSWFGERAGKVKQYLTKGTKVSVTGRLQVGDNGEPRIWTKDGVNHASVELSVLDLTLLGGGEKADTAPADDELPF